MAKRKVTTKAKKAVRAATRKVKTVAKKAKRPAPKDQNALVASQMTAVTPYLAVNDAAGAIEWYKKVFNAKTVGQAMPAPGGKIMHATIKIGDAILFLSDVFPGSEMQDPTRTGPSVNLNVYHRDADKMWERATANGAKVVMPLD
ncbi:MAG TPA: VOC family protein, partial [Candidatus Thermoplasmatota archaeon]|nr:VOC family protein [Candidatus Thermoplasmatota archaeon]